MTTTRTPTRTPLTFRSTMTADLVDSMASDSSVLYAARVSTRESGHITEDAGSEKNVGLIKMLMRNRHGSPFEHATMTFYIEAPIFVLREFMRHRIASYNEESGRYKQLKPVFYVPSSKRMLTQVGRPGHYTFESGTQEQHDLVNELTKTSASWAYNAYERMLEAGVAREVARMVLPLNIYSSTYVTMNARALMNFLSLRTIREGSHFPSFPQREIEMVAEQMEAHWASLMPVTHAAFNASGRVAP